MIVKQKSGQKKLHLTGIFCMVFICCIFLVACDALDELDDFEEDGTLELEPVAIQSGVGAGAVIFQNEPECRTTNVKAGLEELEDEISDLGDVDIDSVKLNYIEGTYEASWDPGTVASLTCKLTITGVQEGSPSTEIAETVLNEGTGDLSDTLTQDQIDVINYYLKNKKEDFEYCVTCDNLGELTSYEVTYFVDINVTIKGEI
jgi:hypothetical protein